MGTPGKSGALITNDHFQQTVMEINGAGDFQVRVFVVPMDNGVGQGLAQGEQDEELVLDAALIIKKVLDQKAGLINLGQQ